MDQKTREKELAKLEKFRASLIEMLHTAAADSNGFEVSQVASLLESNLAAYTRVVRSGMKGVENGAPTEGN